MNFPLSDCSLGDLFPLYPSLPSQPQQMSQSRISKPRSPPKKPPPPKIFVCSSPNCGKRFSKKWNLQAHERLHTGSTPFVCRLGCGEAYMWMSSRKGHELNRCKYALKKKNNSRGSAHTSRRQAAPNSEAKNNNKGSISTGSNDTYLQPSLSLDSRPTATKSKDSDTSSSLIVLEETSDCLSNVTEDVLEQDNIDKAESTMLLDADLVLADISLPDSDIFTDDFLEWLLTRCGPTETQDSSGAISSLTY